ncbi:MAG: PaaI family thioesterase [Oxalobacteraceae bacterium]|jgi:1,4-dihydroxy-2-naphthoyl-CoA hydrolase|nr:PaaI family thioesterase [Oxalobacteraceae bacterium]
MTTLPTKQLHERQRGTLPDLLGFDIVSASTQEIKAGFDIKPHHLAPNGYLHAASIIMLADTSCGYGCMITLPEGANSFTTIELKSNFLGTAREGKVDCIATPVHLGRTTQVWDATVSAAGKTIALFRCTQMVLWPKA